MTSYKIRLTGKNYLPLRLIVAIGISAFSWPAVFAQPLTNEAGSSATHAPEIAATLQAIAMELREMHLELMEDRREALQATLPNLEREALAVQERQQRLQEERSSQAQEMAS